MIDPPRVVPREIRPFNAEESRVSLRIVNGHPLEAIFTVAYACGCGSGFGRVESANVDIDAVILNWKVCVDLGACKGGAK
jgi:hypothetical protein